MFGSLVVGSKEKKKQVVALSLFPIIVMDCFPSLLPQDKSLERICSYPLIIAWRGYYSYIIAVCSIGSFSGSYPDGNLFDSDGCNQNDTNTRFSPYVFIVFVSRLPLVFTESMPLKLDQDEELFLRLGKSGNQFGLEPNERKFESSISDQIQC